MEKQKKAPMSDEKKAPMSDEKKAKLIYSGELALFALVFAILGILMLTKVYPSSETRRTIFIWITLFGGAWAIADFFWTLCSKKHRKKASILDKILILPASVTLISYDLYALISQATTADLHTTIIGSVFLYLAVIYGFESVYHYAHPIPGLLDEDEPKPAPAPETPVEGKENQPKEEKNDGSHAN
jgi:uncharacterized membrane protein HdeD (DUF308 family)